jgi:hypothetical protein
LGFLFWGAIVARAVARVLSLRIAFGKEANAWRENAEVVGCRLRPGADLCLHFSACSASADVFCRFEGGRPQTKGKGKDGEFEETYRRQAIDRGCIRDRWQFSSRISFFGGHAPKVRHSRCCSRRKIEVRFLT